MSRLMSVSHTEQAVVERRKTVTRRLGWQMLKPGDTLTLCRKVMGRQGAPLIRLADVEVVSVRREPLEAMRQADVAREGVPADLDHFDELIEIAPGTDTWEPPRWEWVRWFCETMGVTPETEITRIEWKYLP